MDMTLNSLTLTWQMGSLTVIGHKATQQTLALVGNLVPCRKHPSSYIDKCYQQELRNLGKSFCAVFNASLVKVLSGAEDGRSPYSKSETLSKLKAKVLSLRITDI